MTALLIKAELANGTATAGTVTGSGATPVFELCRSLIEAGADPGSALEVYRADVLALRVKTIAAGAKLAVREGNGTIRFAPWRPFVPTSGKALQLRAVSPRSAPSSSAHPRERAA